MKKILLIIYTFILPVCSFAADFSIKNIDLKGSNDSATSMIISFTVILCGLVTYYYFWKHSKIARLRQRIKVKTVQVIKGGKKLILTKRI